MGRCIHFVSPSYEPAGGIVKIMDYVRHAQALGYKVAVYSGVRFDPTVPLFQVPQFVEFKRQAALFKHVRNLRLRSDDLIFFSWPRDYLLFEHRLHAGIDPEQIIHIVQNVRHANPAFTRGFALRLLSRPMTRIMITKEVWEAVRPYLNETSFSQVILEGHNTAYFAAIRKGGVRRWPRLRRIRVGYTTWKSDIGDRTAKVLRRRRDGRFRFAAIRKTVDWRQLRRLYHWCDVFLAGPYREEGFYLPGLEALAAGAILITPDVIGNRVYCRYGRNCLRMELDDPESAADALERLAQMSEEDVERLRKEGYVAVEAHSLKRERSEFAQLLERMEERLKQRAVPV